MEKDFDTTYNIALEDFLAKHFRLGTTWSEMFCQNQGGSTALARISDLAMSRSIAAHLLTESRYLVLFVMHVTNIGAEFNDEGCEVVAAPGSITMEVASSDVSIVSAGTLSGGTTRLIRSSLRRCRWVVWC